MNNRKKIIAIENLLYYIVVLKEFDDKDRNLIIEILEEKIHNLQKEEKQKPSYFKLKFWSKELIKTLLFLGIVIGVLWLVIYIFH